MTYEDLIVAPYVTEDTPVESGISVLGPGSMEEMCAVMIGGEQENENDNDNENEHDDIEIDNDNVMDGSGEGEEGEGDGEGDGVDEGEGDDVMDATI